MAEFDKLDVAEEVHFMPGSGSVAGYGPEQTLQLPYIPMRAGFLGLLPSRSSRVKVTSETVPAGEVDVRRGDTVRATDGEVRLVEGLVID